MTRAVTANVRSGLDAAAARRCLEAAVDLDPDLVGLQEWRAGRWRLLRPHGSVRLVGTPMVLPGGPRYSWVASPLGDCVVGLRAGRYAVTRSRSVLVSLPAVADRGVRRTGLLPPRWVTVTRAHDQQLGHEIGVVCFHLVPGAQAAGRYRVDRSRTSAQHAREVTALTRVVAGLARGCASVWALGDSNFHGLRLPGLTSAWDGIAAGSGTLTSWRRVDDVFGPGSARRVETYVTESDHRMVLVERG